MLENTAGKRLKEVVIKLVQNVVYVANGTLMILLRLASLRIEEYSNQNETARSRKYSIFGSKTDACLFKYNRCKRVIIVS